MERRIKKLTRDLRDELNLPDVEDWFSFTTVINKHSCNTTMKFSVTFDERSKEVLIDILTEATKDRQSDILAGDYSTECLIKYEEVSRLLRGILYSKPLEEKENLTEPNEVLE